MHPTVAAFVLSPIKDGLQPRGEGCDGRLHRHHSVMQSGWNVFQCSHSAFFFFDEERNDSPDLCCRCGTQSRRTGTGDACLCAAAALV